MHRVPRGPIQFGYKIWLGLRLAGIQWRFITGKSNAAQRYQHLRYTWMKNEKNNKNKPLGPYSRTRTDTRTYWHLECTHKNGREADERTTYSRNKLWNVHSFASRSLHWQNDMCSALPRLVGRAVRLMFVARIHFYFAFFEFCIRFLPIHQAFSVAVFSTSFYVHFFTFVRHIWLHSLFQQYLFVATFWFYYYDRRYIGFCFI